MVIVRYPKFNGSHFGLPPMQGSIHRMCDLWQFHAKYDTWARLASGHIWKDCISDTVHSGKNFQNFTFAGIVGWAWSASRPPVQTLRCEAVAKTQSDARWTTRKRPSELRRWLASAQPRACCRRQVHVPSRWSSCQRQQGLQRASIASVFDWWPATGYLSFAACSHRHFSPATEYWTGFPTRESMAWARHSDASRHPTSAWRKSKQTSNETKGTSGKFMKIIHLHP